MRRLYSIETLVLLVPFLPLNLLRAVNSRTMKVESLPRANHWRQSSAFGRRGWPRPIKITCKSDRGLLARAYLGLGAARYY